jgi:tetratricopeptide (TPR) repeat protein
MNSSKSRNRWVSISLAVMLVLLLGFSLIPLVSSIFLGNQRANQPVTSLESRWESEVLGYELVLDREPDNQTAWRGLLEVRLKQGNLPAALVPLEKLAQLNPEQTDYQILLAQSQQQIQDNEGAITTYRNLLASHPENLLGLKGLVDLLVKEKRITEAIKLVQDTAQKALTNPNLSLDVMALQLMLGEIYGQQQQYDQALAVYEQAIKADGQDFRPLLAKALTLQKQGKPDAAQPLFKQAITLAPVQYKDQIQELALDSQER